MFLNKWTVQVSKPGQTDELSFSSKDEALQYAQELVAPLAGETPVSVTLVDPDNRKSVLSPEGDFPPLAAHA